MQFFITGTDTDAGKTIAASWATLHLNATYWKPIQSGLDGPIDYQTVQSITQFPDNRFLPAAYELHEPLSPHEAAKRDGITIDPKSIQLPTNTPVVIEGAGGLMVPLNDDTLMIDLIQQLNIPLILVCRSTLGTINHTLLSLEAIRNRNLPIAGIIINGPKSPHNRQALEQYGQVPVIAEIDWLEPITQKALLAIKPEIDLNSIATTS